VNNINMTPKILYHPKPGTTGFFYGELSELEEYKRRLKEEIKRKWCGKTTYLFEDEVDALIDSIDLNKKP